MKIYLLSLFVMVWGWQPSVTKYVSLFFAGDLMQHETQISSAHRDSLTYRYDDCFELVQKQISNADIAIGNLEVTFGGLPYRGYPAFSAPDEYAKAIRDAGFDVLVTTNNHCMDRGQKGLVRTLDILDSLKIRHVGTYRNKEERENTYPLLLDYQGIKIAILAYTYGTNGNPATGDVIVNSIDTVVMAADIHKARQMKSDCIITYLHWGIEYEQQPSLTQKYLSQWLIDHGVDHIIGSHPHVVQHMELRKDAHYAGNHLVVYSLGNYISNMSATATDNGLSVRMTLVKNYLTTKLLECSYTQTWTERPITGSTCNYFRVVPDYIDKSLLTPSSVLRMNNSLNTSRHLFQSTDSIIHHKK